MIIKCPECGHEVSDQAQTCPSCGIKIAGKITRCPDCGEVIFKEQSECPFCHRSINGALPKIQMEEPKSQPEPEQEMLQPSPRRPRRHRAGITALIVAFVIALVVVFLGIYFMKTQEQKNEQRAFENAIKSSEPLVLQNFLDMYVDAPLQHRDSIKYLLTALMKVETDWNDAFTKGTKLAFERFVKKHPESGHVIEANIKIDSIDWLVAVAANSIEAFQTYLNAHDDGAYYDEARAYIEKLNEHSVTDEERHAVIQLFTNYFNAIALNDETALKATLAPVLTSFLHRQNATPDVVCQYMAKLHEADVTRIQFTPEDNWDIEKLRLSDERCQLCVKFSVLQQIERTNEPREKNIIYLVSAQVSPDGTICELNMKQKSN